MTVLEAERTTLKEYRVLQHAHGLKVIQERGQLSYLAFQTARVLSSDKKGRPIIKRFSDLFDYDEEYKAVFGENKQARKDKKPGIDALERVAAINRRAVNGERKGGFTWQEKTMK